MRAGATEAGWQKKGYKSTQPIGPAMTCAPRLARRSLKTSTTTVRVGATEAGVATEGRQTYAAKGPAVTCAPILVN